MQLILERLNILNKTDILQAVAKFFEDHPVQQCQPCTPGTLTGIADITARRLYDKYYGGNLDISISSFLLST
jgi:hypothetical protein